MKRSEINRILLDMETFLEANSFYLPSWAHYSSENWKSIDKSACREIIENGLGWDVTDMGSSDFQRRGLALFTIRNGGLKPNNKPYAEKIMMIQENQETALHYHAEKIEDIINRGGGILVLELFNSTDPHDYTDEPVDVIIDGVLRRFEAGRKVFLKPGESITLRQGLYHRFYAQEGEGAVMAGEVSSINDDKSDNYFYENIPRYPLIEEDENPVRLLCSDYEKFL